jgi:hypothetical protein
MRTSAAILLSLVAAASAFTPPMMATRAVGKKGAAPASTSKAPPASKGYPSFADAAQNFKLPKISGGGNKASTWTLTPPDFSDPKLQIERDPEFYAAAAKQRLAKKTEFVYDDGLTVIEQKQRAIAPAFLTGSAKSQIDPSAIDDVEGDALLFGLDSDRFQLLFIAVFGLFTLVGSLSGRLNL